MNADRIAEARALCDAATDGEWKVETGPYSDLHWGNLGDAAGVRVRESDESGHGSIGFFSVGFPLADAAFIAAARTLLPEALDTIAALEAIPKVYLHVASTGEGCPTGTWKAGEPEPPPTVAALGDPDAVRGLLAVVARAKEAEAENTRLRDALVEIWRVTEECTTADNDEGRLWSAGDLARAALVSCTERGD